jgi:hypothetical protein
MAGEARTLAKRMSGTMSERLDPANLTPAASLNRVRFTALAGLPIPARMIDWAAYALLSAKALADLTARHGDANAAARSFGERLGWLLVTLRLGDPASRAARPDWDESYWRHWAGVRTVYLGGGIVSGEIGQGIAEQAARVLAEAGMADCRVEVAPWPEHLPVIGAARSLADASSAAGTSSAAVFDFGHSFVKRAIAQYEDGALAAVRLAPRLPAALPKLAAGADLTPEQTLQIGEQLVTTMAETWRAARVADPEVSSTIVASVASYLRDGQPLARQGGAYSYLLGLSDNLANWLGARLTFTLGRHMRVRLLHDGTAAAAAVASQPSTAVIMLGTALGVGFPPEAARGPWTDVRVYDRSSLRD